MKTKRTRTISARVILPSILFLGAVALFCSIPFIGTRADNLGSGTINSNSASPLTWTGISDSPGLNSNTEATCVDTGGVAASCETFTIFVGGTPADWTGKKVQVLLTWGSTANEYDLYIHQGQTTAGTLVTSAVAGPLLTSQVAFIDPSYAGVGYFTIHAVYDTTPAAVTDHYTGSVSVLGTNAGGGTAPPAPADTNGKIGYENYEAPGILTPVVVTSSGGATVEYMGRNSGEPSIGVNWVSTSSSVGGMANFQSDLETLFISFDESGSSLIPKATWVNRRAPTSVAIDSDPIGFTDHVTGRVFASELTLLSPDTPKISYSDNDGISWTPAPLAPGPASAVDHQTIGGGPYHAPIPTGLPYPNSVYYCSQDIAAAFCARSDDGGNTLGTQTPLYNLTQCGGLHGHVKVAPDGTVYVPNRACGGDSAVVVSTDNGITWAVRPIQSSSVTSTPSTDDPAVAIDADGTVYALFSLNGNQATVAVSHDQGQTWTNIYDVAPAPRFGLKNVAFPAAVGGGSSRAAVAFYGSFTDSGDSSADTFPGLWHLFVAQTFDGGQSWTTTDVTPTLPMQRMGLLRGGGGPVDRNLLDFFGIDVDRDGRVLVGYVNGCAGGPCSQAGVAADGSSAVIGNTYSATATIARQSSGRRLFAVNDPTSATSAPGMPFVTEVRSGNVVRLAWNEADTGNLPLSGYQIYRGLTSGAETLLATISNGAATSYTDTTATDPTKTYYYQILAQNSLGTSAPRNEIAAPFVGDTCSGIIIHRNLSSHPESTGGTANQPPLPQLLIDYVAVGEPPSTNELMFKMKVGNLTTLPPNSRWRMVWDWVGSAANPNIDEQYYVGMQTDSSSNPTFTYGTVSTLSAVVVGVPQENQIDAADSGSNYNPDGTITVYVPKSGVGSPQVGDLLGAVNGRTFTGDTPQSNTLERSTALIDHTFVKGSTDASYPAATYALSGNNICSSGNIVPISAVSRKTHGSAGDFDVDLPLIGSPGIEDRTGPNYKVVVTFAEPISQIQAVSVTPGANGTASVSSYTKNNTQVIVNLSGVSNAQVLSINLTGVNGTSHFGDVSIPMGVLIGDTTADRNVNSADISQTKAQSGQYVTYSNFRQDVTADGSLNSADISLVKSKSGTALP